mgnify:CR=1 FL=1
MRRAGQTVPALPIMPDQAIRVLRARLILEEATETIEALGCEVVMNDGELSVRNDFLKQPSILETIDGCCDLSVVTIGTLSALGCPDAPFLAEVDAANLRKFEGDAHRDSHGKWIKPSDFVGPDIEGRLAEVRGLKSANVLH